jgi:hypothetical protein
MNTQGGERIVQGTPAAWALEQAQYFGQDAMNCMRMPETIDEVGYSARLAAHFAGVVLDYLHTRFPTYDIPI